VVFRGKEGRGKGYVMGVESQIGDCRDGLPAGKGKKGSWVLDSCIHQARLLPSPKLWTTDVDWATVMLGCTSSLHIKQVGNPFVCLFACSSVASRLRVNMVEVYGVC
jgi:hypothetical protein